MTKQDYIFQGDALEFLNSLPDGSVDAVITDPPYRMLDVWWDKVWESESEYWCWLESLMIEWHRVLKDQGVFCCFNAMKAKDKMLNLTTRFFESPQLVEWRKPGAWHNVEILCFGRKGGENEIICPSDQLIYDPIPRSIADRHMCEKPKKLADFLVDLCSCPGDLILDSFSGSGAFLSAAKQQGRRFLGSEIDSQWVSRFSSRLKELQEQSEYEALISMINQNRKAKYSK